MNKKSIFYTLFLCTFITIILICTNTSYAANQFEYTLENGYATITAYKGTSSNIIVPNVIDNHKVVAIGKHAFDQKFNTSTNGNILTSVTVSAGIISIGDFAFVGCTNLTTVKLPDTIKNLGDQTFIGCSNLKNINIPEGVQSLGFTGHMFQETGLETITIPRSVTKIPTATFRICKNLKTIKILSKNVSIADDAFEHCSSSLIIYGYAGSTVQKFAKTNNIKFIDIDNVPVAVSRIALYKQSYYLEVGKIVQVKATISPNNATNKRLIYKSANPKVAYINSKGYMKGIAAGNTTICVASADGKIKSYAKVTVTIPAPTKEPIPEPTMVPITAPTSVPTTAPSAITDPGIGKNPPDIIGTTPEPSIAPPVDPSTSAAPPIAGDIPTTGSGDTTTTIGASDGSNPDDNNTTLETTPSTGTDSSATNLVTIIVIPLVGILVITASVFVIKKKKSNS